MQLLKTCLYNKPEVTIKVCILLLPIWLQQKFDHVFSETGFDVICQFLPMKF